MKDEVYAKAFKEVMVILQHTDENLVQKLPFSFLDFIKEHMDKHYEVVFQENIEIDKQPMLEETQAILALICRTYWLTEEEKQFFEEKDKQRQSNLGKTDIETIFQERKMKNLDTEEEKALVVIKKENFFIKLWRKIFIIK